MSIQWGTMVHGTVRRIAARRHAASRSLVAAIALSLVLAAVWTVPARSQPAGDVTGDPAQRRLAEAYIAAVEAGDGAALQRLLHPAVRPCINDETKELFDSILARELRRKPESASYRITSLSANAAIVQGWPSNLFRFPVEATHQLQLDFSFGATRSRTVLRPIGAADGAWYVVLPCPTAEGVEAFRRKQKESGRQP